MVSLHGLEGLWFSGSEFMVEYLTSKPHMDEDLGRLGVGLGD